MKASLTRHARAARRVRIAVDALGGNVSLARGLERRLRTAPWIVEARADASSGRLLIRYDGRTRFTPELLRVLALDVRARDLPCPDAGSGEHAEESLSRAARRLARRTTDVAARAAAAGRRWARRLIDGSDEREAARPAARPREMIDAPWYARSVEEALDSLSTTVAGLSGEEATRRLVRFGANITEAERTRSPSELLLAQLANLPTVLLVGAAGVSLLLGDVIDAVVIVVVIGVNVAVGYRIERRNDRLLASWRRLEAGESRALRDGDVTAVAAADLVPGDVILLRPGDVIPADARVLEAQRLSCDEAALTGESEAQSKDDRPVRAGSVLAERRSMVYAGTQVVAGRGRAVVVSTGEHREVARVRRLVERTADPEAPLQRKLGSLGRRATFAGLAAGGVVLGVSLLRGRPLAAGLRAAVALGVAAIPEGMPVVATAALVTAMERMRRHGMVVRRVTAAETLGAVTVVCLDKTGTLTENEMRVEQLVIDGRAMGSEIRARPDAILQDRVTLALAAGVLNSDVEYHDDKGRGLQVAGSSTERALVEAARSAGLDPQGLRVRFPRLALHERRNDRHYVISIHGAASGHLAFVKGAPEQILPLCDRDGGGALDDSRRSGLLAQNEAMGRAGQRVLALAWARLAAADEFPRAFELVGLVGLRDPLRAGAREAIAAASRAGIRTIILTGDQRSTAAAIAEAVGLEGAAVDGAELAARLTAGDPGAAEQLDGIAVLSRVAPEHKLAVVRALRQRGHIVAMAGDGINDAPALKVADVGIAFGAGASDIARQTADVVLESADLRAILAAIGEGRIISDNLRRSIRFLFASNLSEMLLSLAGLVVSAEPLSSLQLLWINLLTDTLPGLALALEPGDPDVLGRPPAAPGAPLLSAEDWRRLGRDGALLGALGAVGFGLGGSLGAFSSLTAGQLSYAITCRADELPPDARFVRLLGGAVGLQIAAFLVPPLRALLRLPTSGALGAVGLGGMAAGFSLPLLVKACARQFAAGDRTPERERGEIR